MAMDSSVKKIEELPLTVTDSTSPMTTKGVYAAISYMLCAGNFLVV